MTSWPLLSNQMPCSEREREGQPGTGKTLVSRSNQMPCSGREREGPVSFPANG